VRTDQQMQAIRRRPRNAAQVERLQRRVIERGSVAHRHEQPGRGCRDFDDVVTTAKRGEHASDEARIDRFGFGRLCLHASRR
jgi:hypothetical protein